MADYLTPDDIDGSVIVTIRAVKKEMIGGRPRLVLYFDEERKGLVLTREFADTLTAAYGPHPLVQEFFASPEGQEH